MGSPCTYKNCSIRRDGNTHMFKYPVKNKLRCENWIINAQKLEFLKLKKSQLENKLICQYHFKDNDFQNDRKNKLNLDAVPTIDGPYCSSDESSYGNKYNFDTIKQISNCVENEIEIEEHDVLDDPAIKRIFPDLSIIKKEISQYDEESTFNIEDKEKEKEKEIDKIPEVKPIIKDEPIFSLHRELKCEEAIQQTTINANVKINSSPQKNNNEAFTDTKLETHLRFKTFLESLEDDDYDNTDKTCDDHNRNAQYFNANNPSKSPDEFSAKKTYGDYKVIRNNIFIFGSKPSSEVKIVVKDISTYLNASKLYCKKCRILFSNIHRLKCHISKVHSTKQKDMVYNKIKERVKSITIKCNICSIKFSNKGNMLRHMRRFHIDCKSNNTRNTIPKQNKSLPDETKSGKTNQQRNGTNKDKPTTDNQCFHCTEHFETSSALIEHLYAIIGPTKTVGGEHAVQQTHPQCNEDTNTKLIKSTNKNVSRDELKENTENNRCIENENNESGCYDSDDNQSTFTQEIDNHEINLTNSDTIIQDKSFYQCFICSIYIVYFKWYTLHLEGHNINITSDIEKSSFDPQCKFCKLKYNKVKYYNRHISKCHSEKKKMKVRLDSRALQSVLFQCFKCNIFFLSASAAKNHLEHNYIYAQWTCLQCHRLFKQIDKQLHLQQHLISENITTWTLSKSALNSALYKCSKCAVHFYEEEYFLHSSACGLEPPNAAYCNRCDILINKTDMDLHVHHHIEKIQCTIIESDVFINEEKKNTDNEINHKLKIRCRSKFALTFCPTCNCFISDLSSTRKVHIERRCGVICSRMCKKCGLVFTNKGYLSHKTLHDEMKNLTLQSFYFYDINSKKQIRPPMPKYPICSICEVHFLNKTIMKQHECHKQKFQKCKICKIKLTEAAFRLHMNFHNYKISTAYNKKVVIKYKNDDPSDNANNSKVNPERDVSLNNIALEQENDSVEQSEFIYTCVSCHVTVHNYDKVVEHCQEHYICEEIKTSDSKNYSIDEKFDQSVMFDPFYMRFDNDVWIKHIFVNFTNEQIMKRVADSIYKFECRLKMEIIQSGQANLTLYKCCVCRSYIDPSLLLQHAGTGCNSARKYPCSHCGIVFYSTDYRNTHEKIHRRSGFRISSHRIVLFNKIEHRDCIKIMKNSKNKFILYQCRNCEGIVDKLDRNSHKCYFDTLIKCSYCDLLFYDQDHNSHIVKHERVSSFVSEHIIVVMFGVSRESREPRDDDKPKSTFSGTIYDLTFYKCESCEICLESKNEMSGHVCVVKSNKSICPKCHLCFKKKKVDAHLQLHEKHVELEYGDFHSNIILFNSHVKEKNGVIATEKCSWEQNQNIEDESALNNDSSANTKPTIYKCKCGLHFLHIDNARKHANNCQPKVKSSKQNCSKCNLLFTPGELFNHLLKHHNKRKVKYDYDIVTVD